MKVQQERYVLVYKVLLEDKSKISLANDDVEVDQLQIIVQTEIIHEVTTMGNVMVQHQENQYK